jgi:Asp-tRNA(Asn)/Glu-tRNA(Gln) amidotransferase A subunit family amidase
MTTTGSDEVWRLSAVEQRRLIGAREVSAGELLEAHLERVAAVNPAVNAVVALDAEVARARAAEVDRCLAAGEDPGPLAGLVTAHKDLTETADFVTTYGSPVFAGNRPVADSLLVARVKAAGAVAIGKTNTPEFGAGSHSFNPVYGVTRNPFDPALSAGGSSGGAAAALRCGMVAIADGSDAGGSLRNPAAWNSVVGFRSSSRLVPRVGPGNAWSTLSIEGPMARSVADLALMLAAIAGPHADDPLAMPFDAAGLHPLQAADLSTLRVGFTEDFGGCLVDEDIRRTFRARIAAIAPLFTCCEPLGVDLVNGLDGRDGERSSADFAFDVLRAEGFLAAHAGADRRTLSPNLAANLALAEHSTLADRAQAHQLQTRLQRRLAEAMRAERGGFDLVIAPVTGVSPFSWTTLYAESVQGQATRNYYHWLGLTYVVTLSTHPALSLPCGVDEQGLPFGLQVIGRAQGDVALLSAALALELATSGQPGLGRVRPDLARLRTPRPELRNIVTHPPLPLPLPV